MMKFQKLSHLIIHPDKKWTSNCADCYKRKYLGGTDHCCSVFNHLPILHLTMVQKMLQENKQGVASEGWMITKLKYCKVSWCGLCNTHSFSHLPENSKCTSTSSRTSLQSKAMTNCDDISYFVCSRCETTCMVTDCRTSHSGDKKCEVYICHATHTWARCCSHPGEDFTALEEYDEKISPLKRPTIDRRSLIPLNPFSPQQKKDLNILESSSLLSKTQHFHTDEFEKRRNDNKKILIEFVRKYLELWSKHVIELWQEKIYRFGDREEQQHGPASHPIFTMEYVNNLVVDLLIVINIDD